MHVSQEKEKHRNRLMKTYLALCECFLQQQLNERGAPHEDTSCQGEPLVVGDGLMLGVPHRQGDEEVEGDGDEDWGQETDQEQEEEIIADKLLLNHTLLIDMIVLIKCLLGVSRNESAGAFLLLLNVTHICSYKQEEFIIDPLFLR